MGYTVTCPKLGKIGSFTFKGDAVVYKRRLDESTLCSGPHKIIEDKEA